MIPALGVAGCVLAALVAVVLSAGGGSNDNASSAGGTAAPLAAQEQSSDSAKSSGGSASAGTASSSSALAAPAPSAPARQRRVERSTRLELTTTDVQAASDGVVRATQATGGFVQSSQVPPATGARPRRSSCAFRPAASTTRWPG